MTPAPSLPEPSTTTDPAATFIDYLAYFRAEVRRKVADLDAAGLTASLVPSGWSPAELVCHLGHMEQRWLVWGFLGEQVEKPWGDQDGTGRWTTDRPVAELLDAMDDVGQRTRAIVAGSDLSDRAITGGRFTDEQNAPTLIRRSPPTRRCAIRRTSARGSRCAVSADRAGACGTSRRPT